MPLYPSISITQRQAIRFIFIHKFWFIIICIILFQYKEPTYTEEVKYTDAPTYTKETEYTDAPTWNGKVKHTDAPEPVSNLKYRSKIRPKSVTIS